MAIITETMAELADAGYKDGTELKFRIFGGDLGPNGEDLSGATTIAERIFVKANVPITRDDGRITRDRITKWILLNDTEIAGLNAGDSATIRPILKRAFDWMRDNLLQ